MRTTRSFFGLEISVRDALVGLLGAVSLGYGMTNFQTKDDANSEHATIRLEIAASEKRQNIRTDAIEKKVEAVDGKMNTVVETTAWIRGRLEPK